MHVLSLGPSMPCLEWGEHVRRGVGPEANAPQRPDARVERHSGLRQRVRFCHQRWQARTEQRAPVIARLIQAASMCSLQKRSRAIFMIYVTIHDPLY